MSIHIKRAYDEAQPSDGYRVLVDRIWPRGISKADARLDDWAKVLAPSTELRKWFGHEPSRWDGFRQRYGQELAANEAAHDALDELRKRAKSSGVTLVFGARNTANNNAVFLKQLLEQG